MISRTMIIAGRLTTAPGAAPGAAAIHSRQLEAEARQNPLEVAAPPDRDRHRADGVLEDQIPSDHPRENFTQRRVRIGVGAAGDRNHRGELRVTERGKRARNAGGHVRKDDGGTSLVGRRRARQHEDARADDRADAEQRQVPRGQAAAECLPAVLHVADQLLDRLCFQQVRIHARSRRRL